MSRNEFYSDLYDYQFKFIIIGDSGVGKSSLIQKYCKGIFTSEYKKTIGVDFLEKIIWWDPMNGNGKLLYSITFFCAWTIYAVFYRYFRTSLFIAILNIKMILFKTNGAV